MLAEKFFLYLETLIRSQSHSDGSPRVVSTSPHVPLAPQGGTGNRRDDRGLGRLTRP